MTGTVLHDLRWAVRGLRRDPRFTVVATTTLGLAIGAVVATFSLVDGLALRPLPLPGADRLVVPRSVSIKTGHQWSVAFADFNDWSSSQVFGSVALYQCGEGDLAGASEPERLSECSVGADFFKTLGIAPIIGRGFTAEEFEKDRPSPMVLSWSYFTTHFGGDRSVLNRRFHLSGGDAYVAGVLPPGVEYPLGVQAWLPLRRAPMDHDLERRDNFIFSAVARLRPDSTLPQTRAKLATLAERIAHEQPAIRQNVTVSAIPLLDYVTGSRLRRILVALLAAVLFVLLIGCANTANLLLARGARREREVAIRAALGASRGALARQLMIESLLLALSASVLALPVAAFAVRGLVAVAPTDTPRLGTIHLDARALGFAVVIAVVSAVLFGLLPALRGSSSEPGRSLVTSDVRTTGGVRQRRARAFLVIAELAICLAVLAGASLALHSLRALLRTETGLDTQNLVTFSLSLPKAYDTDAKRALFYREAFAELSAQPGIVAAAGSSALPLGGGGFYLGRAFLAKGQPEPPSAPDVSAGWNIVTPGWFRTSRITLLSGRDFNTGDAGTTQPVMVVNEAFARQMFGKANPLGRLVRSWRDENVYREVVGVVGNVRYEGVDDRDHALVYVPHSQDAWAGLSIAIRSPLPVSEVIREARQVIGRLEPTLALASVATMEEIRDRSLGDSRALSLLLSVMAIAALALAALGIAGVLTYTVAQRTHEIGIRMAIGAARSQVLSMILREAGAMIGAGLAIGVGLGWLAGRLLAPLLYETQPTDIGPYLAASGVLAACGLLAAWLPASRAAAVDPATVLRESA
jgi:putative ABC transport system permease protein